MEISKDLNPLIPTHYFRINKNFLTAVDFFNLCQRSQINAESSDFQCAARMFKTCTVYVVRSIFSLSLSNGKMTIADRYPVCMNQNYTFFGHIDKKYIFVCVPQNFGN